MIALCGLDCSVCIARLGKSALSGIVGAMEKANPNIAPGYAKLRSMNIAGTWMTAIATNVGIIHADISSEWKKNISMSIR